MVLTADACHSHAISGPMFLQSVSSEVTRPPKVAKRAAGFRVCYPDQVVRDADPQSKLERVAMCLSSRCCQHCPFVTRAELLFSKQHSLLLSHARSALVHVNPLVVLSVRLFNRRHNNVPLF